MSKKVIVVAGPTAVGKTSLGVYLAHRFNGEIINGDSIQVYKELNIGSAKVTEEEKEGVVHHLLDYMDVEQPYNVALFQKDAREKIEEILSSGKTPIVVGGTGLYIKALLYDYNFIEMDRNEEEYNDLTNEEIYEKLKQLDPKSLEKIHVNNRKRLVRALQMAESGTSKSEQEANQSHTLVYDSYIIGLTIDRELLRERINKRVDIMVNSGLVEEINYLFNKYPLDSHGFQGIGYKEFIGYYKGNTSLEDTIELIKTHTRQFAKRQYTWFNNQLDVNWYDITEKDFKEKVASDVQEFLK